LINERITLQKRDIEYIKKLQPDVILSVGWRRIVPKVLLNTPKIAALNAHGSLLPKYKGFAPINWAILMGEKSKKNKACKFYKNELRSFPHPRSLKALSIREQYWGTVTGRKYVESFVLLREIL